MLLFLALAAFPQIPADSAEAGAPEERGNVLILVADDLGIDQIEAYGTGPDPCKTPNVDALVRKGVRFTNCWSNPICSPTRATIQTGRYSIRTGIGHLVRRNTRALALEELTIPEALDLGTGSAYAHAAIGKWHLGNASVGGASAANLAGYSHFSGTLGNIEAPETYYAFRKAVDGEMVEVTGYATTDTVDDTLAWLADAPEPWFCIVNFNAPHAPWHVPPAPLHSVDFDQADTDRLRYKAAVEALDTEMGRLLAGLGPARQRTTTFFLADNGTPCPVLPEGTPEGQCKWHLYQGGVQVPLVVSGLGVTAYGRRCDALVNCSDLFATVMELAGAEFAFPGPAPWERDSVSLVPYFAEPERPPLRGLAYAELFSPLGPGPYSTESLALTDGVFKVIVSRGYYRHPEPRELYDLRVDPLEQLNLLQAGPLSQEARSAARALKQGLQAIRQ